MAAARRIIHAYGLRRSGTSVVMAWIRGAYLREPPDSADLAKHEDCPVDESEADRYLVVRDYRNVAASRLRAQSAYPNGHNLFPMDASTSAMWLAHARYAKSNPQGSVLFDTWIQSQAYRGFIAMALGLPRLIGVPERPAGTSSSFGTLDGLLERYKEAPVEYPDEIREVNEELFGP